MRALLYLYPRAWRERYGDELMMLLDEHRPSLRLAIDLIAGAVDAHLNPQLPLQCAASRRQEDVAVASVFNYCRLLDVTDAEYRRSAVWMLAGTLALSLIYMALKRTFGDHPLIDAFGVSAFPIALVISSRETYFKPYSRAAGAALMTAMILLVFLVSLAASFLATLT